MKPFKMAQPSLRLSGSGEKNSIRENSQSHSNLWASVGDSLVQTVPHARHKSPVNVSYQCSCPCRLNSSSPSGWLMLDQRQGEQSVDSHCRWCDRPYHPHPSAYIAAGLCRSHIAVVFFFIVIVACARLPKRVRLRSAREWCYPLHFIYSCHA